MHQHVNETFFPVTEDYLAKCLRNEWETRCAFCNQPFEIGHVIHSKFNGAKYKKRHIACSVRAQLISRGDARFAIIGYGSKNKLPEKVAPRPIAMFPQR